MQLASYWLTRVVLVTTFAVCFLANSKADEVSSNLEAIKQNHRALKNVAPYLIEAKMSASNRDSDQYVVSRVFLGPKWMLGTSFDYFGKNDALHKAGDRMICVVQEASNDLAVEVADPYRIFEGLYGIPRSPVWSGSDQRFERLQSVYTKFSKIAAEDPQEQQRLLEKLILNRDPWVSSLALDWRTKVTEGDHNEDIAANQQICLDFAKNWSSLATLTLTAQMYLDRRLCSTVELEWSKSQLRKDLVLKWPDRIENDVDALAFEQRFRDLCGGEQLFYSFNEWGQISDEFALIAASRWKNSARWDKYLSKIKAPIDLLAQRRVPNLDAEAFLVDVLEKSDDAEARKAAAQFLAETTKPTATEHVTNVLKKLHDPELEKILRPYLEIKPKKSAVPVIPNKNSSGQVNRSIPK